MQRDNTWLTKTIVAHRGLHDNKIYPENSLGAFEQAIKHGYGIEFDVWLTNDGELIVHHDPSLKRTCNRKQNTRDIDSSKLDDYKLFGTNYSIPKFVDVLNLVNGQVNLVIEIKPTNKVDKTCSMIWNILKDYKGVYCIESFDTRVVKWWATNHPEIILGQLCDRYLFHKILIRATKHYKFVDFLAVSIDNLPSRYYQKLLKKRKKLIIFTWTVRTKKHFNLAIENADNFIFETNLKNPEYIPLPDKNNTYCHPKYR